MEILKEMVTKLQGFQEAETSEPAAAAASQEGSDLFVEPAQSSPEEANTQQVRKVAFTVVFQGFDQYSVGGLFWIERFLNTSLSLDPSFSSWLHLQTSMFAAVVSGSGAVQRASSLSEPRQTKALVCSAD